MEITNYAIVIWISAILIISFDAVIIIGSKNLSSRVFSLLSFATAIWAISQGFLVSSETSELANLLIRIQYILGIFISIGFYYFSIIYPHDIRPAIKSYFVALFVVLLYGYLYLCTNYMISGVHKISGGSRWAWELSNLNLLFDLSFYILWFLALFNIFRSYQNAKNELRTNLKNMFYALLFGIIPPAIVNIFLPSIGEYELNWIGPITSLIWIFILTNSIIKYRQMNVKIVVTEVIAICMTTVFFINIFMGISANIYLRIAIFVVFIILAVYLVKISLVEAHQKDLLRILNDTLEQRVNDKTREVKISYEHEKKARRDLEKLNETKDQFILITQHHLRSPVTNIRTELKKLISKFESSGDQETNDALARMKRSVIRLSKIIDDFLNITTLKAGEKILSVTDENIKQIIEEILSELDIDIKNMNIAVKYSEEISAWPNAKIDRQKVYEALLIIIENAVRYNRNEGLIEIKTRTEHDSFVIEIFNTGTGITFDEKVKLFSRAFYRSDRAKALHPIGMGIGLSVARAIIRAHHGDITISSNGENEGATVTTTLPIDFIRQIGAII